MQQDIHERLDQMPLFLLWFWRWVLVWHIGAEFAESQLLDLLYEDGVIPAGGTGWPRRTRYLPSTYPLPYTDLRGTPIPAPSECHGVGRGTSVPTGNTDACRRSDCAGRSPPFCQKKKKEAKNRNRKRGHF